MVDLKTLAETVEMMRNYQKSFFRERKPSDLQNSKMTEKIVDDMVKEILHGGTTNQISLEI